MKSFEIFSCSVNYENAEELYKKTGFSIANAIDRSLSDHETKLEVDHVPVFITLPTFFADRDLHGGLFDLYVKSFSKYDMEAICDSNKDVINRCVAELVNDLAEELSKIVVPINNLDNVIYDEATDAFYVKIGCAQPDTIRLSCSLVKE